MIGFVWGGFRDDGRRTWRLGACEARRDAHGRVEDRRPSREAAPTGPAIPVHGRSCL
jgi:hypothetical protein